MKKTSFLISTLAACLFITSLAVAEKQYNKPVTTGKSANSQIGEIELEDVGSGVIAGSRGGGGKSGAKSKGKAKAGDGSGKKSTPSKRGKKR